MAAVLLNSFLFLVCLGAGAWLLVRFRGQAGGGFFSQMRLGVSRDGGAETQLRVVKRTYLGWKSSAIDLDWQGRRYLVILQENRCTLIDSKPEEPQVSNCENNMEVH